MRVSLRSMLVAGVSTLAVSSIAVAPVRPVAEQPVAQVSAPVHLTAAVTPLTPTDVAAALREVSAIADELDMPLAAGDVAVQNAASDFVDWAYQGILQWTNYFALELAPWALGWFPFGGLISDSIYALYDPIVTFTDSVVYGLIDPVLNDPLNLAVWTNGLSQVAYTAVASLLNAGINEINAVIDYFLGWLPPLPPIPPLSAAAETTLAAPADVAGAQALIPGLIGGPIAAVSDVAAGVAHSLVNLWYPPSGVIDGGVGFVSNVLGGFSWLPLVGVADFQLNEVWGLIHTGGNTLAAFANSLIDIANDLVANTVEDGLAPALEDAFYTALQSVQTHGNAAFDAVKNFALDQVQYLTGVWVPHTTSPRVDLPQGPPSEIRFAVPEVLRDVLGPLAGLVPSGQLGSVPLNTNLASPAESTGDRGELTETETAASEEAIDAEPTSAEPEPMSPEPATPETADQDETPGDAAEAEDSPRVGKRDRTSSYTSGRDKADDAAADSETSEDDATTPDSGEPSEEKNASPDTEDKDRDPASDRDGSADGAQ